MASLLTNIAHSGSFGKSFRFRRVLATAPLPLKETYCPVSPHHPVMSSEYLDNRQRN